MKIRNYLFLAAAAILTATFTTRAAEPVLSPRAALLQHEFRKVPSTGGDLDLTKDRPTGNARAWSLAQDFRKIAGVSHDIDLAHAPRPTLSPRDARFEMALRENAVGQFQIAPLK